MTATHEIQEFRYRFDRDGNVVCYDRIDGLAPIRVEEKDNFAEMIFPYAEDFETFCQIAREVIVLAASTAGGPCGAYIETPYKFAACRALLTHLK